MLVASKDTATHNEHLHLLLQWFQDYGLVINISKSLFGHDSIDFLVHHITHPGIIPLHNKVVAIKSFQPPENVKGLQEFVGMANFYQRFIPAAARKMSPLFEALAGKLRALVWNDVRMKAF